MGAGHGHGHAAGRAEDRGRLRAVLAVTLAFVVVQVVGSWLSGSLALLADAGHMVTDAAAVGLALSASYVATLPASDRRTFGYHRAEILAALVNAVVLLAVCGYLVVEGVRRLREPPTVEAGTMLAFAAVGLGANLVSLLLLRGRRDSSLNLRGAYLEVLGDLIGSVLVIVAAAVILTTGWDAADPIASLAIAALIVPRALMLLRDVMRVLSQSTPAETDVAEIRDHIVRTRGVVAVHDVHVWAITTGAHVFSAHVEVEPAVFAEGRVGELLDELGGCLSEHFDVEHSTFQLEPSGRGRHEHATHG